MKVIYIFNIYNSKSNIIKKKRLSEAINKMLIVREKSQVWGHTASFKYNLKYIKRITIYSVRPYRIWN